MRCLAGAVSLIALATLATGFQNADLTAEQARALLEESFPGAEVTIAEARAEEARVVVPERFGGDPTWVVAATLSGIGDPLEVNAHVRMYQEGLKVVRVEYHGLTMNTDDLLEAIHHDRQWKTVNHMRDIATALGTMRVDTGRYAEDLMELEQLGYMPVAPVNDGWGNFFVYVSPAAHTYVLTSLGSDSKAGPGPPDHWVTAPFEPDIILSDGRFIQAPIGRR